MSQHKDRAFRADINGLRAWAVVAVVLFHFRVPGFTGGYVGVDVFFVISGYLMTQIIVSGLESAERGFSLWAFYLSRARRIFPALAALSGVLLLAGWFTLPANEYRLLANHAIASVAFFSNIKYWREAGYFDPASHEKWLLHTWSLSVEWQFYLLLPIFLMLVWRLWPGRGKQRLALIALFGASLALSIIASPWRPTAAFYLLPTRVWELVSGGLVYLAWPALNTWSKQRRNVEYGGLMLIAASILLLGGIKSWPGVWALMPAMGTVLVLLANRDDSIFTATPLMQWLGTRSYSIYLWHWPVVVLLVYTELEHDPLAVFSGIAASLLLGHVSYHLVENPSRKWLQSAHWRTGVLAIGLGGFIVVAPAWVVRSQDGIRGRLPVEVERAFNGATDKNPRMTECHVGESTPVPECRYGGSQLGAIVIGDSHAASFVRSVERALSDSQKHVLDWTLSSCPTVAGVKKTEANGGPACGEFVSRAIETSKTMPEDAPLLVVNRASSYAFGPTEPERAKEPFPSIYFSTPHASPTPAFLREYRERFIATVCEFAKNRQVYLVRPIPEMPEHVPKSMGRALLLGKKKEIKLPLDAYFKRHQYIWDTQDEASRQCGVRVLDPLPYLCSDGACLSAINGRPLYYDDDHLSEYGGSLLEPLLQQMFSEKGQVDPP